MFLQCLDGLEKDLDIGDRDYIFNMDVEALYDSLNRDQVEVALREAMAECRPEWMEDLVNWVITGVKMSLDSAVGKFGEKWYKSKDGVATGGKLCVYIANIYVFYAFKRIINSNVNNHVNSLLYFVRFVDDCTGGWRVVVENPQWGLALRRNKKIL